VLVGSCSWHVQGVHRKALSFRLGKASRRSCCRSGTARQLCGTGTHTGAFLSSSLIYWGLAQSIAPAAEKTSAEPCSPVTQPPLPRRRAQCQRRGRWCDRPAGGGSMAASPPPRQQPAALPLRLSVSPGICPAAPALRAAPQTVMARVTSCTAARCRCGDGDRARCHNRRLGTF